MSRKIFFGFLILAVFLTFISGCAQEQEGQPAQTPETPTQPQITEQPATQTFSMEEIAKHNSKEDCWLLISGKVYDVTKNIGVHPGGAAILEGCGKDATTLFETRPMGSGTPHSEKAREYLAKTYIGNLK